MTNGDLVITVTEHDGTRKSDDSDILKKEDIDLEKNPVEVEEDMDMDKFERSVVRAVGNIKTEKRPFRHTIG